MLSLCITICSCAHLTYQSPYFKKKIIHLSDDEFIVYVILKVKDENNQYKKIFVSNFTLHSLEGKHIPWHDFTDTLSNILNNKIYTPKKDIDSLDLKPINYAFLKELEESKYKKVYSKYVDNELWMLKQDLSDIEQSTLAYYFIEHGLLVMGSCGSLYNVGEINSRKKHYKSKRSNHVYEESDFQ